jgi:hypothetical protein
MKSEHEIVVQRTQSFDERKNRALAKARRKKLEAQAAPHVIKLQALSRTFLTKSRNDKHSRAALLLQSHTR